MSFATFTRYRAFVERYESDPLDPSLLIAEEGDLSVYYAPFEWINPRSRVVLVGITPGRVQAANALGEAQRAIAEGESDENVLKRAKQIGAFSGAMRPNLIALMDRIGLNRWLRIESCHELFNGSSHLLQTASALQFPVFNKGSNYNGTPDMLKSSLLRKMLVDQFGAMANALPGAVFVPLGPVPSKALEWLSEQRQLPSSRVLHGLPHPSGANAERIAYFLGRKPRASLSAKTDPDKLDAARDRLSKSVAALL